MERAMEPHPSAEQTAYRLAIGEREDLRVGVRTLPPGQLRRLILDQQTGVARLWLLGLASTAPPRARLRA
jgi:hypothetical protein